MKTTLLLINEFVCQHMRLHMWDAQQCAVVGMSVENAARDAQPKSHRLAEEGEPTQSG